MERAPATQEERIPVCGKCGPAGSQLQAETSRPINTGGDTGVGSAAGPDRGSTIVLVDSRSVGELAANGHSTGGLGRQMSVNRGKRMWRIPTPHLLFSRIERFGEGKEWIHRVQSKRTRRRVTVDGFFCVPVARVSRRPMPLRLHAKERIRWHSWRVAYPMLVPVPTRPGPLSRSIRIAWKGGLGWR